MAKKNETVTATPAPATPSSNRLRRTSSIQMIEEVAFNAKVPLAIVGSPGTTKSAIIRKLAQEKGMNLVTIIGSRMAPTDISGILEKATVTTPDGEQIDCTVPLINRWQYELLQNPNTVVFIDEASNTPPATQASILNFLQDRELPDGTKIPDEVVIIAAMNPIEQSADGYEISAPTANRFLWMPWDPEPVLWFDGMENGFWQPCSQGELYWKGEIVAFLKENDSFLHAMPKEGEAQKDSFIANDPVLSAVAGYTWPSRRSWDNLSKVLGSMKEKGTGSSLLEDKIIQSAVGHKAAVAFRDFLSKRIDLDIDKLLAKPSSIPWAKLTEDESNIIFRDAIQRLENNKTYTQRYGSIANRIESTIGVFESAVKAGHSDRAGIHFDNFMTNYQTAGKSSDRAKVQARVMKIMTDLKDVTQFAG